MYTLMNIKKIYNIVIIRDYKTLIYHSNEKYI